MIGCLRSRFLLLATLLSGASLPAQVATQPQPVTPQPVAPQPAPAMEMTVPSDGEGLMTLHAYSNLIQMPVLVLGPGMLPVPPIRPERFTLRIDNGPWYRPAHVRPEGADPISLTIVLDFGGRAAELMPKIGASIEQLIPLGLTARDHVSVFAMQCALYDMMRDVPAQPGVLQAKVAEALMKWAARSHTKPPPPCEEKLHLWDALGVATLRLGQLPGRRVLLAVTDGEDRGSKNSAADLASAMQQRAITAFGLRPMLPTVVGRPNFLTPVTRPRLAFESTSVVTTDDPLERLCEVSGGIALSANSWDVGKQLARIPELVRGRYVLEFPRPWNSTAGNHQIDVQIARSADFVRVSGTTVPLPDPALIADPTTLQSDPTLTPQMGKKPTALKPPPQSF